jgi:hypothetical protein
MLEGYLKINQLPLQSLNPVKGFKRQRRAVVAEAVSTENGNVHYTFEVKYPRNLVKMLQAFEEPCKRTHCAFRFTGVEEQSGPLGIGRTKKIVGALTKESALKFLVAR